MDTLEKAMKVMRETAVDEADDLNKSEKKKKDENTIYTSFLETPDFILEEISSSPLSPDSPFIPGETELEFVKYSKLNDTFERVRETTYCEKIYKPITDKIVLKGGVGLPTGVTDYENTSEIINQIRDFLIKYVQLPTFYENLLPQLVLFYWVYEKFPFVPYLHFIGGTGTGKTTAMETLGSICYKPIDTTGSLTIASLFRLATSWKGTLLIDEFNTVGGEESGEMISFLKSGVSNRLIFRTEGEKKKEVEVYIVKSPKVFTSENPITDAGLQSRTLEIKMDKNNRRVPLYKLPHYHQEAQEIRNKLLLWRLRNFSKVDLSKIEFGYPELEPFDRRVQQILTPIYYFSDDAARKQIAVFAKEQEIETKRQRRESLDGLIFEVIYDHYKMPTTTDLALSTIVGIVNKTATKYPITERKLAGIVRKVLGIDTKRVGTGGEKETILLFEGKEELIEEKAIYFGLSYPEISGESVQCGEPGTMKTTSPRKVTPQPTQPPQEEVAQSVEEEQEGIPF